jgi:hypothetical protein
MLLEGEEGEVNGQSVVAGVDGSAASLTALRWVPACRRRTDVLLRTVRCWMHMNCPVLLFPPAMTTRRAPSPDLAGVPA